MRENPFRQDNEEIRELVKQFQNLKSGRGNSFLEEEAFEKIDCLQCAACCKNYSPRFKTPDVKRISKHLGIKESVFIETYLNVETGRKGHPPRGACMECNDDELIAAVKYMMQQSAVDKNYNLW